MLLDLQDGQMTGQFGLDHVPASPSQEVDSESPLTTKDISGQNSFDLLNSANLLLLWESKLRDRLLTIGSTECVMIWKKSYTRQNRLIYRLARSMHHISDTELIGLLKAVATWVSPTASDGVRGSKPPRPWDRGIPLSQQ